MYYSNVFTQPELQPLSKDVQPNAFLMDTEESAHNVFWIGNRPGLTANTHYDATANIFTQIVGRKQITLFSPQSWKELHLFPSQHPSHRQSQNYFFETRAAKGKTAPWTTYWGVADVEPGDMLFLPPFWFHRVVSRGSPSISMATWSRPPELKVANSLLGDADGVPPAVRSDGTVANKLDPRVAVTAWYIRLVAREVVALFPSPSLKATEDRAPEYGLLKDVVTSRYLSLVPSLADREPGLGCGSGWGEHRCPKDVPDQVDGEWASLVSGAKQVREKLQGLPSRGGHDSGVAAIIIGDFLEAVASGVVGINRICPFLRCVAFPQAWIRSNEV